MDNVFDPSTWAGQAGFGGLVVLSLFALIVLLLREHNKERSEWRQADMAERKASRESHDKLTLAVHSLEIAIREGRRD